MALFYLVRHGETAWNAEGKLCGRTDIELNDAGRRQAERLGERLRALPPAAIYASPLRRAAETAAIIADVAASLPRHADGGVKPPLQIDSRLVELNYGEWEGKKFAEVKSQDAEVYRRWDRDPAREAPPGGESGREAIARMAAFLDEVRARHTGPNEHVVVVTHKTICRLALCHALGLPPSEYRRRLCMENAALNIIAPTEDGWRVILVNDTSHLACLRREAATPNETF
jgi:alpha-ribazole phosphatase